MKLAAYFLIAAGFLAGSYSAVRDVEEVDWSVFTAALAIGALGIAVSRFSAGKAAREEGAIAMGIRNVEESLRRITENLKDLNARVQEIDVYDIRGDIDALFVADIDTFVEGREIIGRRHGLQAYADIMSHFAAGERYLNRVWCCSADGYIDEAVASLLRAEQELLEAHRLLGEAESGHCD